MTSKRQYENICSSKRRTILARFLKIVRLNKWTRRTTRSGNVRENGKEGEKGKEKAKKQLTQEGGPWYYIQALAERAFERGAERGRRNLENDTEKREKRQLILK